MVSEVEESEAMTITYALSCKKMFQFKNMALEGDSLMRGKLLQNQTYN